jgi:hypothetical protein
VTDSPSLSGVSATTAFRAISFVRQLERCHEVFSDVFHIDLGHNMIPSTISPPRQKELAIVIAAHDVIR